MPRPRSSQPTPAELLVLTVLWERGALTGPEIAEAVNADADAPRAYTSVMSLLNTMRGKGFVTRRPSGRTYVYTASRGRVPTQVELVRELVRQAFDGSARDLVAGLLDGTAPDADELAAIRSLIDRYQAARPEPPDVTADPP